MNPGDTGPTHAHVAAFASDGVLARVAANASLRELVLSVLTSCWQDNDLPAEILPGLLHDALLTPNSEAAANAIVDRLFGPLAPPQFRTRYEQARTRKFAAFARVLDPWVAPGTVVDLGAGGTDLLDALTTDSTLTAVDIELSNPRPGSRAKLLRQSRPDRIPLADDSVDTAIATGVLHHIDVDVRQRLITDTARILRPGGRLLLLEETFPANASGDTDIDSDALAVACFGAKPDVATGQNDNFQRLGLPEQMTFLAFTDWWGNRVMKGSLAIPLPYTFLTSEQWRVELDDADLPIMETRNLGLCSGGGHMASPRMLFVCERR